MQISHGKYAYLTVRNQFPKSVELLKCSRREIAPRIDGFESREDARKRRMLAYFILEGHCRDCDVA